MLPSSSWPAASTFGLNLSAYGSALDERRDVGELALLDERLAVGERDREDVRQRAAGERRGERRAGPVVLVGDESMSGLAPRTA